MTYDDYKTNGELFIKALNDNGIKAEIISNEVIDGIQHITYNFYPKYPIDNIVLHYTMEDGKVTFTEN